jgi:methylglyoxal synthase
MEMYCMSKKANVALVAHDGKKAAMLQWAAA